MTNPLQMDQDDLLRLNKVLRHRLRNSASGLKASVSFLSKGLADRLTPQEMEYFPLILNECDAITELTNRMQLALDPPACSPPASLGEILEITLASIRQRHPTAQIDLDGAHERLTAIVPQKDAVAIPLAEILANAIEAAPRQTVRLEIANEGPDFVLAITDRGPGTDPGLFQGPRPFFTTKARHLGLGLTIAHRRIALLAGRLEHDATENAHTIRIRWPEPPHSPQKAVAAEMPDT